MPDDFEHAAHLPVTALMQGQVHDRTAAPHRDDAQLRRRGPAAFEKNALPQFFDCFRLETAAQHCAVNFIDAETRMRQRVR
jgi:hypothetical protein